MLSFSYILLLAPAFVNSFQLVKLDDGAAESSTTISAAASSFVASSTSLESSSSTIDESFTASVPAASTTTSSILDNGNNESPATSLAAASSTSFLTSFSASTSTSSAAPSATSDAWGYHPIGCWAEPTAGKTFPVVYSIDGMTVEECRGLCGGKYQYFGLEYGQECWCGTNSSLATQVDPSNCNFACSGDKTEICGADNMLSLYNASIPVPVPAPLKSIGDYSYIGCFSEATGIRALTLGRTIDYDLMTTEMCAAACEGFTFFGLEYGGECYCGNELNDGSVPQPNDQCNFDCPGNALEICGAGNRLSMYSNVPYLPPVTWQEIGCFSDKKHHMDLLSKKGPMSPEICLSEAAARLTAATPTTYRYVGVENGKSCYAATAQPTPVMTSMVGKKACTKTCDKNPLETCGGRAMYNLYASASVVFTAPPVTVTA